MSTEQETQSKGAMTAHWMHAQMWAKLPYPTKKFTDQTIVVTGSNIGMGLEAARHFVRLDAKRVILAVRNIEKGEAAKKSIIESEKRPENTVEVWDLDLASYASTKAFAQRANRDLDRLDVVVGNAGIYMYDFEMAEEDESTITVNNVSTFLMGIMLLPKLRETSITHHKETVLTLTGSFVHYLTDFPERNADNIFKGLADKKKARMADR
jgi:retinol dehydrogenase-12